MGVVYAWVCQGIKWVCPEVGVAFEFSRFPFLLLSIYATIFPDLTFWNYQSACYENVATAIHINWKCQGLGINITNCIYASIFWSPQTTHVERQFILLASGNLEDRRVSMTRSIELYGSSGVTQWLSFCPLFSVWVSTPKKQQKLGVKVSSKLDLK